MTVLRKRWKTILAFVLVVAATSGGVAWIVHDSRRQDRAICTRGNDLRDTLDQTFRNVLMANGRPVAPRPGAELPPVKSREEAILQRRLENALRPIRDSKRDCGKPAAS